MPQTIDDFFKPTSTQVAEKIMGMNIEYKDGLYVVAAAKPYFGDSKQTQRKPRLMHGGIMMFNIRGFPHFCVSTGTSPEQDYFLIHRLQTKEGGVINTANGVSQALGLSFEDDGRRFTDYFGLSGKTKPSNFTKADPAGASTCLGVYELKR